MRGQFAVGHEQYESILHKSRYAGVKELFILSTCNRTEIYGIAPGEEILAQLLCGETVGSIETFNELCYIKQGTDAIEHLFNVAAGLDSQILGDYEIVGQIKQAVKFAKQRHCIGHFLERLTNTVLQSSKAIKSQTSLSSGTVSVSFAAVQFIRDNVSDVKNKKIVLLGTGKIGRNTCKNLIDYLETKNIVLINRTEEKASALSEEMELLHAPYHETFMQMQDADIIIVATNAEQPVITKKELVNSNQKLLIDLSIPNNIDPSLKELPYITLLNVDDLSKIKDAALQKRMAEVPKAKSVIAAHINEFTEWHSLRRNAPVLKAVKQKLLDMHQSNLFLNTRSNYSPAFTSSNDSNIQKVINNMAVKMREQHQPGCNYIEAINDFITGRAN